MTKFFNNNEVISYESINDFASKIKFYKKNDKLRKKLLKKVKKNISSYLMRL